MVTAERVAELIAELGSSRGDVLETERYGQSGWAVGKFTFAWLRPFSKADVKRFGDNRVPEDPILAVCTDGFAEKEAILAEQRPGFFSIPHFDGFAAVLIELRQARIRDVRDVLRDAYRSVSAPGAL